MGPRPCSIDRSRASRRRLESALGPPAGFTPAAFISSIRMGAPKLQEWTAARHHT